MSEPQFICLACGEPLMFDPVIVLLQYCEHCRNEVQRMREEERKNLHNLILEETASPAVGEKK